MIKHNGIRKIDNNKKGKESPSRPIEKLKLKYGIQKHS